MPSKRISNSLSIIIILVVSIIILAATFAYQYIVMQKVYVLLESFSKSQSMSPKNNK